MAKVLTLLAQAVINSGDLGDGQRQEAIDHIEHLASEAAKPVQERKLSVGKAVAAKLGELVSMATDIEKFWEIVRPIVLGLFPG
jgi:hypothetical protein